MLQTWSSIMGEWPGAPQVELHELRCGDLTLALVFHLYWYLVFRKGIATFG